MLPTRPTMPPSSGASSPRRDSMPPPRRGSTRAPPVYIEAIRAPERARRRAGGFSSRVRLSTREGLALMVLAEALLRVPDAATQDRLIEDKLAGGDWARARGGGGNLVRAAPRPGRSACRAASSSRATRRTASSPASSGGSASRRCAPRRARRCACSAIISSSARRSARRFAAPVRRRRAASATPTTCSARARGRGPTPSDYFDAYAAAIAAIGKAAGEGQPARPARHLGEAVGASPALRGGEARARPRASWSPRLLDLAREAKRHDLNFTVDAEEADRLELSLEVIGAVAGRCLARRLGRLRPRHPGLSEARHRGDRLGRRISPAPSAAA